MARGDRPPRGPREPFMRPPATDPARDAVMHAVARQFKRYPDLMLNALETRTLDDRDAAFAHALYDMVIRRWITLRFLVRSNLRYEWDEVHPAARSAMLCGAAQLLFMRSVPPHAAVNESVNWAQDAAGGRTGALVNAILRTIGRLLEPAPVEPVEGDSATGPPTPVDPSGHIASRTLIEAWDDRRDALPMSSGGAVQLNEPLLPPDPLERLAFAASIPLPLLRAWAKHMPMREVRAVALHGLVEAPVILNTTHANAPLPEGLLPHDAPGHHVIADPAGISLGALLESRRDLWVQDPASSLAVESTVGLTPKLIVDACAGLGTKTRQLAATFPEARIIATDIDRVRHAGLARAFAGQERVTIARYDQLTEFAGQADLILLDVPCSNTGVLARRLEARYRWSEDRANELVSMQRQIIADALRLLRRGGSGGILYSTCSLDPAENEEIAAWARKWHGFDAVREHRRIPSGQPGDPPTRYTDGSYAVLLA